MKFFNRFIIISIFLLLSACVNISTSNMQQTDKLQDNEGIVVARTVSEGVDIGQLRIHDREGGELALPLARLAVKKEEQVLILKVQAGKRLYLSSYASYGGNAYFPRDKFLFEVTPGSITYIGDLVVAEDYSTVSVGVVDNEKETVEKARKLAPKLFEKYEYRKHLAGS